MDDLVGQDSTPTQLVKGLTLYGRLKPVHDELQKLYKALVAARAELLNNPNGPRSNLNLHASLTRDYAQTLLTLCKPARGRLANLLSEECAAGLMYSLLYDLCLHLSHYLEGKISDTEDSEGHSHPNETDPEPERWFSVRAGGAIRDLLELLAKGDHSETAPHMNSDSQGLLMPDLLKNYHEDFENFLKDEDTKFQTMKNSKAKEVVATDGNAVHQRRVRPTVGVLALWSEPVDDTVVELGLAQAAFSYVTDLWKLGKETKFPDSLLEYMDQFGVYIFVVLDKLESKVKAPKMIRNSCLKIFLESFLFLAKSSDSDSLSDACRKNNYLSPRFSICLKDVLNLFDDGYEKTKFSACSHYRQLNAYSSFDECARSLGDLEHSDKSEIYYPSSMDEHAYQNIQCGYLVKLVDYLNSLLMKFLLSDVEESIKKKSATCQAVRCCSLNLEESMKSLTDRRFRKIFELRGCGYKLAYCSSVKFLMFSQCPFFLHQPDTLNHDPFFKLMSEQMEKLPYSMDVPERDEKTLHAVHGRRILSHALADAICESSLSVLVFGTKPTSRRGTKPTSRRFDKYMKNFFSANLTFALEHAIPFLSSASVESVVGKLGELIENMKYDMKSDVTLKKRFQEPEVIAKNHHIGSRLSPFIISYDDPYVCLVAMFGKLALVLYRCCLDDAQAELCLDTLQQVGLCCCLDSEFVLQEMIPSLFHKSPAVVAKSLKFLECLFIGTMNGGRLAPVDYCHECCTEKAVVKPPEDGDEEGDEFLLLKGSRNLQVSYGKVLKTVGRWFPKSKYEEVCYKSLKWAGMKSYSAFKEKFDPIYQEHVSRLARFGRREIQSVILDLVYEPMLQTLKDMRVLSEILTDSVKISALQFVFSGLSVVLLTNSDFKVKLSDSFWKTWSKLLLHGERDNYLLSSACYDLACAVIISELESKDGQVVPYPMRLQKHFECLKVFENAILDVQTKWISLISRGADKTEELISQSGNVVAVWRCLAEFCCLPQFVSFLEVRFFKKPSAESTSLDPLRTLKTLLKCLASEGDSWSRDALFSCPELTFDLVRSLLKVLSICPAWEGKRSAALGEVNNSLYLHLLTRNIKPLIFAVLDVNHSEAVNRKSGQLWATSGDPQARSSDRASTIAAYLFAVDPNACETRLWPELLEAVLSALMHRASLLVQQVEAAKAKAKAQVKADKKAEAALAAVPLSTRVTAIGSSLSAYISRVGTGASTSTAPELPEQQQEEEMATFSDSDDEAGEDYNDKSDDEDAGGNDETNVEMLVGEEPALSKEKFDEAVLLLEESLTKVIEVCENVSPFIEQYLVAVDVMNELLKGFDYILRNSATFKGVAGLVLRLWALIARSKISTKQLADFLNIFMGKKPPVNEMLSVLESLLLQSMKNPHSYVQFSNSSVGFNNRCYTPQHLCAFDMHLHCLHPKAPVPVHGFVFRTKSLPRCNKSFCNYRTQIIHDNHVRSGVSQARIGCVVPKSDSPCSWIPFTNDTTLAFWCKLDRDKWLDGPIYVKDWEKDDFVFKVNSCLHIFTVGFEKLMLSAFLSARTGYCQLEINRRASDEELYSDVTKCQLDFRKFLDGEWHFVTLSFPGINTKKAAKIEVQCSIDGQLFSDEVLLELPPQGSISPDFHFVLLGHRGLVYTDQSGVVREDPESCNLKDSLSMTSFTLWKLPNLDVLQILLLMSFGKDVENLLAAQRESSADLLKSFITPEVMAYLKLHCTDTEQTDFICGKLENLVLNLNKTLEFNFNSHRPDEFVLYDSGDRVVQDVSGRYGFASVRYALHFEGPVYPVQQQGALQALLQLGGARALMYLLARVVELNTTDYNTAPRATRNNRSNSSYFFNFEDSSGAVYTFVDELEEYVKLDHYSGQPILVRKEEDKETSTERSKSVNNPGGGCNQAACLRLLYTCLRQSPDLCRQFHAFNGTQMVLRLLCSAKMDTRLEVFKVLLDQCFSESMITLEQTSVMFSVVEDAPVQGRFVLPSCRVLVTDAGLLAALLQHWHTVELKKREIRDAAYPTLVANMKTDGLEECEVEWRKADFKKSLTLPERLVSDWTFGPCHLLDVLYRAVVSVLSRSKASVFDTLNFQLLHRSPVLQNCLHVAQELRVRDWEGMQAKSLLLKELLSVFLPSKNKEVPYWSTVDSNLQTAFGEVLRLLVLGVDPNAALWWHGKSCTTRLYKFYNPKRLLLLATLPETRLRILVDTELAEEVTEDAARVVPVLDATVAADECKGVLTSVDEKLLASINAVKNPVDQSASLGVGLETNKDGRLDSSAQEQASAVPLAAAVDAVTTAGLGLDSLSEQASPSSRSLAKSPVPLDGEGLASNNTSESSSTKDANLRGAVDLRKSVGGSKNSAPSSPEAISSCGTGRSSPILEMGQKVDQAIAHTVLPEVSRGAFHLITAVYEFLKLQDGKGFEVFVQTKLKPHQLSVLANHENVGVRCVVVKILKDVLYRCSARTRASFKEQLVVVHHQLACHESSKDLLEECFLLMVSDPRPSSDPSTPLDLITSRLKEKLVQFEVQERILAYSSPLLAVLPKVDGVKFKDMAKVLDFFSAVVDYCTRCDGADRLLAVNGLGESLLLTIDSSLESTSFDASPIVNLYANLVRSLLLLGDDFVSRGFDLITKFFLCCENQRSNPKRFSACLKAFGKVLINCLKSLIRAMLVASALKLEAVLKTTELSPAYIGQVSKEEMQKRASFIPADQSSSYYADLLEDSPLAERIELESINSRNYVDRALKLLKMCANFVSVLDWVTFAPATASSLCVSWSLPLFLLDLHIAMLQSWDPALTSATRAGFAGKKLPRHQLDLLSLEYEPEACSFLPQLVCALAHPKADRLARRGLVARLGRHSKLILLYCRQADLQIYKTTCYFLWIARTIYSISKLSGVFRNIDAMLDQFSFELNTQEVDSSRHSQFESWVNKRTARARTAVEFDVETCMSKSLVEHESHKKVITDLYNKFLVMHASLKKTVFKRVNAAEDNFCQQTFNWLDLCTACSAPHSPWKGNTSMWWELVEYRNENLTRSLVAQKAFNVGKQLFTGESSKHPLKRKKPLESVFGCNYESQVMMKGCLSGSSLENSAGELEVKFTGKGWVIKPGIEFWGTIFVVGGVGISFKGKKTVFGWCKRVEKSFDSTFHVCFKRMVKVKKMRYRLHDTALEVHLRDRTSWFFVCGSQEDRDRVVWLLLAESGLTEETRTHDAVSKATAAWQARRISNFEYLMLLNDLAGRNYNDLNQYPVFPYVLADYTSDVLNLNDPTSYRDLSKPLPAQTKEREEYFVERYKGRTETNVQEAGIPFHYTSLYSNGIVVKSYLVRLPPFTLYFLHFQGGKFDHPSRTFHSLEQAYNSITRDTYTDFKEAIPEMYYLPEMFCNREEFDMRGNEKKGRVDKVTLPPWSQGDCRKFVLYHRAALESDYVTERLPQWIDLVFGFKQCGKKCVEAVNMYHPSGYPEYLGKTATSPDLWSDMTGMYGEVPLQLFPSTAHPRLHKDPLKEGLAMEFLESVSPSTTLLGMRWGCFAFFSSTSRNELHACPSSASANRIGLNRDLVLSGAATSLFLAAPIGTQLLVDDSQLIHILQAFSSDGLLRVWSQNFAMSYPLASLPSYTKVTCCSAEADQVWLGTDCGQVLLYNLEFMKCSSGERTVQCSSSHILLGHGGCVTTICACPHFNVCVSGDASGDCCVWDVHTPTLVRRVTCFSYRVTRVLVSKTSGDWLCATDGCSEANLTVSAPAGATARLQLYTLNGELVAETVLPEPVRCLAMTSLSEGRAVNVIAAVLHSHLVLYSSWDLKNLISTKLDPQNPVDLLRWSDDSQHLAVQWRTGQCMVFVSAAAAAKKTRPLPVKDIDLPVLLKLPQ